MKSVTLSLTPTTFVVTGDTKEEMLANAKKAFIEQVSKNLFPHIKYSINDADALTKELLQQFIERHHRCHVSGPSRRKW
ncbi:hypothetical protein OCF61_21330 [Bacillus cereus]|nr:hypothetical protein [Bacillus cereus]